MTGHDDAAPVRLEPHPADERLAVLRVDRPPVNAFDPRMWDLFDAVTESLHGDTLYRAVVITGGPRHFAAGADVTTPACWTPPSRRDSATRGGRWRCVTPSRRSAPPWTCRSRRASPLRR